MQIETQYTNMLPEERKPLCITFQTDFTSLENCKIWREKAINHVSQWKLMCFLNQFVPLPKVDLGITDAGICWEDQWLGPSFEMPSAVGAYGFVTFFCSVA